MKESEKIDKYLDLARERKKLWNIRFKVIPIVVSALGTDTGSQEKALEEMEISGRIETIQATALFESAKYLEKSWRP